MKQFSSRKRVLSASLRRVRSVARLWSLITFVVFGGSCFGQQGSDLVLPATALTAGSTFYQAPNSITNGASFTVQAAGSATFTAGNYIRLEPGFNATAGTAAVTFHAVINANVQGAPITISGQPPAPSSPSKEYIYLGGRAVAVENPH